MKQKIYLITGLMASGKSTVSDLLAKSIEKCVHLRGDVFRKMIISGRENMSATPSAEAVRQLYLRYKLTADAAKSYFDNGFSVVIQDNYYGDELNRMINYLHKYPVEVVVDVPDKLITLIVVFFILKGLPNKLTTLYEANSEIETLD